MSLRSPLGQARGLGSAKDGVGHWWMQRLSAVALVPLSLWFVYSVVRFQLADYPTLLTWLHAPYVAIVLAMYFAALFYHSALGIQVVIEDYVHSEWYKIPALVLNKFVHFAAASIAIYSVIRLAVPFGGLA
jgi:succinate dehydrogenase / fumarate reductase, membrane anchor subunit